MNFYFLTGIGSMRTVPVLPDNGDGTYPIDLTIEAHELVDDAEQTLYYGLSYVVGLEDDVLKLLDGTSR